MLRTEPIDHDFESPYQGGAGLITDADIDYNGGVEIAIFYFHQLYSVRQENQVITERTQRMYISTGYRHWFKPTLSAALGFFSSYAMGEEQVVRNDFKMNNAPVTSASDTTEYGFDLSLQYEPWHKDRWSVIFDARYAYSVTAKPHEDESFVSFLVGLKYFVQSREEGLH